VDDVQVIDSIVGHDAFLVEHQAMGRVIREAFD
jgi:homoserine acetyltransferase